MTATKQARHDLAAELATSSHINIVYANPVTSVDPPCIELRPAEGDGGYVSFNSEAYGTFCNRAVSIIARVMTTRKGEDAEWDWLDDRVDDIESSIGSASAHMISASAPRVAQYGPVEVLFSDVEIVLTL